MSSDSGVSPVSPFWGSGRHAHLLLWYDITDEIIGVYDSPSLGWRLGAYRDDHNAARNY